MERIADDVWQLRGPDLRFPGGFRLPASSTVIRLPDRSLIVYSPVTVDDSTAAEVARLGEVAHVIAPSRLHHMYARAAAARWPRATIHAAPGVATKQPELRIDRELGATIEPAWRDVLDVELIAGAPGINEVVMLHRPSSTLLCADLVFHVTQPANRMTRLMLALMGTGGGRLAQSRVWRFARKDRAAIRGSLDRVLGWPIARVAPCHGEPSELAPVELAGRMTRAYGGRPALALVTADAS